MLDELLQALDADRPVVWCRLVETRGSTPQKAGATMLVFESGAQAGTLGGGCVEAEVKRKALAALHDHRTEIARFQLDSDYGWDDGLICGGRMLVLIQPVRRGSPGEHYFRRFHATIAAREGVTEIIRFEEKAGLPAPAQWLVDGQGKPIASLAESSTLPADAMHLLKGLASRPRPYVAHGFSYLPHLSRCPLLIVGGGHVGQAVGNLAADLDFDVWVVDDRAEYVSPERFPKAQRRLAGRFEEVLPSLEITPDTYCLIVTRGHNHDELALFHLAERGARYVGMIGSKRKIRLIMDDLRQEGVSSAALDAVFAPVGIDIGSQTVPEIAVSICAELVAHRNCEGVVPRRWADDVVAGGPD
jgi:xanthine dehydrogenase accessory factor